MKNYKNRKWKLSYFYILVISFAIAQFENEPFADKKVNKKHLIVPSETSILIDGELDEDIYQLIIPITDFVQEYPDNMGVPTEQTEVYLTYDSRAIYLGVNLFDSEPSKIVRQLAPRDDWYGAFDEMADWFCIEIDSRHDHQTSYSFAVNASGVLSDEMVFNDSEYDSDWNAVWHAKVKINELGWSLEIEIPFSNLPFFEGQELEWGINITRFIQRKHETISWVVFPLDTEGIVSKYGHLIGLKGIYPPAKFEFKPYTLLGAVNYNDIRLINYEDPISWVPNYKSIYPSYFGLDLQYSINTNSKLTLAFNPDFGQIESDPAEVNLTAYETYFKEKRPFFINDSDIFETPIEVFYSRRIGETAWGEGIEVISDTSRGQIETDTIYHNINEKIISSYKLTGKTKSGISFGLLGAFTNLKDTSETIEVDGLDKRKYLISRIKKDLFLNNALIDNSSIGILSTSSINDSEHVFSIDGMTNLLDNKVASDVQFIIDSKKNQGIYGNISYFPEGIFSFWFDYYKYDRNFNINNLGYLWRNNYIQNKIGTKLQSLEPWKLIRNFSLVVEANIEKNIVGLDLGKAIDLVYDIQFQNYWGFGGGLYQIWDHYDDRKIIIGDDERMFGPTIKIPMLNGLHINFSSDKHKKIWGTFSYSYASNKRDDLEKGQYFELTYKPNPHFNISASYDKYRLDKQFHFLETLYESIDSMYHHIFSDINRKIDIITLRATGSINKDLSLRCYLEIFMNNDYYDRESYSEYLENQNIFDSNTSYIQGGGQWVKNGVPMPVYTQELDNFLDELSYLDPNIYNEFYSKYTNMVFNSIIKWNYTKGSNIYFVFSSNKTINGKSFSGSNRFFDFINYNNKERWVDLLRDQTIMIKIDYWFEK